MTGNQHEATRDAAGDSVTIDHAGDGKTTFSCSGKTKSGSEWSAHFTIPHAIPDGIAAGRLKRWHTRSLSGDDQNIADHTWGCFHCYYCLFGIPGSGEFMDILYHDLGEIKMGDSPYPAKTRSSELKSLMDREEAAARIEIIPELENLMMDSMPWRVKIADLMDARNFMIVEHLLGNLTARRTIIDCVAALMAHLDSVKEECMKSEKDMADWERAAEETLNPWTHIR